MIKNYGAWFIQFPTFSYLRIDGCLAAPYRLPRYPSDHIVLLELVRQICEFDVIVKKEKHKTSFSGDFPLGIGVAEVCPSIQSAHIVGDELAAYGFSFHSKRTNFDITGEAQKKATKEYRHKDDLEDYWANIKYDLEARKKRYSRLPVDVIRQYNVKLIPDQLEDDGNLVQDHAYESVKDRSIGEINWNEDEVT